MKKSTTSASLGAPPEAIETTTETAAASSLGAEGTALTVVTLTTEGDIVDLEAAMLSQGDDDDDVYGKKYRTTSEDINNRYKGGVGGIAMPHILSLASHVFFLLHPCRTPICSVF